MGIQSHGSGRLTASATIATGVAQLCGVLIETDGTNAATVIVYDNTAASGTILYKRIVAGSANGNLDQFNFPVRADTGLYLSISGTGAAAILYRG